MHGIRLMDAAAIRSIRIVALTQGCTATAEACERELQRRQYNQPNGVAA